MEIVHSSWPATAQVVSFFAMTASHLDIRGVTENIQELFETTTGLEWDGLWQNM